MRLFLVCAIAVVMEQYLQVKVHTVILVVMIAGTTLAAWQDIKEIRK